MRDFPRATHPFLLSSRVMSTAFAKTRRAKIIRASSSRHNWRSFNQARSFAQSLGLRSAIKWKYFAKSGHRPADIPSSPSTVYAEHWQGFPDFLGYGRHWPRKWRPFEQAREFSRSLGLRSWADWCAFRKSGKRPADIPCDLLLVYAAKWISSADFFGYESRKPRIWRPFKESCEYMRSLGLRSCKEWAAFSKSGRRPSDIPRTPSRVYPEQWRGFPDFLGFHRAPQPWRSFVEAREFARSLKLPSFSAWRVFCRSENCPNDIPRLPCTVYTNEWKGYPDFLGFKYAQGRTVKRRMRHAPWCSYEAANRFVRSLGLRSSPEWKGYARGGRPDLPPLPDDIPADPNKCYSRSGWISWFDFLGVKPVIFMSYDAAKTYIRPFGLKTAPEYIKFAMEFCHQRPAPIMRLPSAPRSYYRDTGWAGWDDFLSRPVAVVSVSSNAPSGIEQP